MKKTKQEVEEKRKQKEEKLKKEERKNRGHYIPQYELDRARENKLKATAMKGGNEVLAYKYNNFFKSGQAFQCYSWISKEQSRSIGIEKMIRVNNGPS